jgi:hypothetical protein
MGLKPPVPTGRPHQRRQQAQFDLWPRIEYSPEREDQLRSLTSRDGVVVMDALTTH